MTERDIAVGIDLGTSNTCVAVAEGGRARVLADAAGDKVHGSVVSFQADGRVIVGNAAKPFLSSQPDRTVSSAKRLMGRFYFSDEVQKARVRYGYRLVEGPNAAVQIAIDYDRYTPQDIAALVLKRMRSLAEGALGRKVEKAVITVPAYFNDNQRQATRDAGRIAGLEVLRIINEPTAAALAYGYGRDVAQRVAIYDFGGGTFDVSVLEIGADIYEVLSTAGDTYLGGDDIDERVVDFLANAFFQAHGVDLREDKALLPRLRVIAEEGKQTLSTVAQHTFEIPEVKLPKGSASLNVALTQTDLARMSTDLIQRTFKVCDEAMQAARVSTADLDGVILVGGPTRLPFIRTAVQHYFGKRPLSDVNPDEVVALGAALQADSLVNAGSAMLLDVTPLTLRLATVAGYTEEIIPRNTPIPIERTRTFTTARDGQDRVQVIVLQGEDRQQRNCEMLAQFEFAGLRRAPRGEVKVEVTFEIDASGIVHVRAKDVETGRAAATEIKLSSGLSEAEIAAKADKTQVANITALPP